MITDLYYAAETADRDWQSALVRTYGRRACDARYDGRGISTQELLTLFNAKKSADLTLHNAVRMVGNGVLA